MRFFLVLGGIFFLYLSVIGFYDTNREIDVLKNGKNVKMKIIRLPGSCLGTKVKWHMGVEYQGKIFDKVVSGVYCEEHKIGDLVDIIFLDNSDKILLPFENPYTELISTVIFGIVGLAIIIWYGILRKPLYDFKK